MEGGRCIVTWNVLLSSCMMMALGVRTHRFMWMNDERQRGVSTAGAVD